MSSLSVARDAIAQEIKRLAADRKRLEAVLQSLDNDDRPETPATAKKAEKKRLRLKDDVAADISSKIVKAVRAHRDGASRKDILTYLARNGYEVGRHFNEPHLNKLVGTLISGDSPAIRREGDKGRARYHTT